MVFNKIVTFLAEWDENEGPKIIDIYPESQKLELEEITMQIFASFQAVFGNSDDVVFEKTSLILPLKTQKVTAKILFDSYKSKDVRGGRRPFVVTFIVPVNFVQRELYQFNNIQEQIVEIYAKNKEIQLKDYFDKVLEDTRNIAQKMKSEADSFLKKKEYKQSVEGYREARFLLKITKDIASMTETGKNLVMALTKHMNQVHEIASEKAKQQNHAEAEKDYLLAVKLASESKNEKLMKQSSKQLAIFYRAWIKKMDKDAQVAIKSNDFKTAFKTYAKIIKIAKKMKNEKLIGKYELELGKLPP